MTASDGKPDGRCSLARPTKGKDFPASLLFLRAHRHLDDQGCLWRGVRSVTQAAWSLAKEWRRWIMNSKQIDWSSEVNASRCRHHFVTDLLEPGWRETLVKWLGLLNLKKGAVDSSNRGNNRYVKTVWMRCPAREALPPSGIDILWVLAYSASVIIKFKWLPDGSYTSPSLKCIHLFFTYSLFLHFFLLSHVLAHKSAWVSASLKCTISLKNYAIEYRHPKNPKLFALSISETLK